MNREETIKWISDSFLVAARLTDWARGISGRDGPGTECLWKNSVHFTDKAVKEAFIAAQEVLDE